MAWEKREVVQRVLVCDLCGERIPERDVWGSVVFDKRPEIYTKNDTTPKSWWRFGWRRTGHPRYEFRQFDMHCDCLYDLLMTYRKERGLDG